MAGKTAVEALERRRRVAELDLKGLAPAAIAAAVGADPRTVASDLALLARERADDTDLAGERYRLLWAARAAETAAWGLANTLPDKDVNGRLGALGKVLAAQEQVAKVVGEIHALALERKVADLERALVDIQDSLSAGQPR